MSDPNPSAATRDYLIHREAQERARAERAADLSVRRAHQAMADRYAALLCEELSAA